MFILGIMTGTSVDGIDAAVVKFGQNESDFEIVFTKIYQFCQTLEVDIKELINGKKFSCEEISEIQESYENEIVRVIQLVQKECKIKLDLVALHG